MRPEQILFPPDLELGWKQAESCIAEIEIMANKIWRDAGIMMPDEAATEMKLDAIDSFLTATAEALGLAVGQVYGERGRIRWMLDTDSLQWRTFASIDGQSPREMIFKKPFAY